MADLEANRAGRVTPRQRFMLVRGSAVLIFLTAIGLVIVIALGPNLINVFQDLGFFGGVIVLLFFLMCLVMTIVGAFGAGVVLADTVVGRVRSITGAPTLRREGASTNALARPLPSGYTYPGHYKYKVIVGDREFDIGSAAAENLARDTRKVRVYYSAYSGTLLSMEPATSDSAS